jgi:hypothetical protein
MLLRTGAAGVRCNLISWIALNSVKNLAAYFYTKYDCVLLCGQLQVLLFTCGTEITDLQYQPTGSRH